MLKPYSSDNLTTTVEPSSGIMRVMWARPLLTAGLIDSYYELLEEAAQVNCRFWHLDMRQRIWPAATFTHWFVNTFAPLAAQRLDGPLYMAYWLGGRHRVHITSSLTMNMQQQVAKSSVYPVSFDKETDARAWLLQQQKAQRFE